MRSLIALLTVALASTAQAQSDPALSLRVPTDSNAQRLRVVAIGPPLTDSAPQLHSTMPQWCNTGRRGRRVAQSAVAGVFVGGNLALYQYFRRAWWSGERAPFHLNYDWNGYFRDQDKAGHLLGGYLLSEGGRELLESACMSEKKATLFAVAYVSCKLEGCSSCWRRVRRGLVFEFWDLRSHIILGEFGLFCPLQKGMRSIR